MGAAARVAASLEEEAAVADGLEAEIRTSHAKAARMLAHAVASEHEAALGEAKRIDAQAKAADQRARGRPTSARRR